MINFLMVLLLDIQQVYPLSFLHILFDVLDSPNCIPIQYFYANPIL